MSLDIFDSGLHAVDSGFQVLDSSLCQWNIGFRILIVSGIPDSLSCIPDSKAQKSRFHKQNFPDSLHMGKLLRLLDIYDIPRG